MNIPIADLLEAHIFDGYTNIDVREAYRAFETGMFRPSKREGWQGIDINYKGNWLCLCRTDLFDNVGTGLCAKKTVQQWIKYYKARIVYGARYNGKNFCVIDQLSDG